MTFFLRLIARLGRNPPFMRRPLRLAANLTLDLKDRHRAQPRKILWILAHPRSGSTLLMHVLSSHPEILGYGERNATYSSAEDLRKLEVDAFFIRRQFSRDFNWVIDQINHDRFLRDESLLDHPRIKKIFLIREPRASIASAVEVLGAFHGTTKEQAIASYLERLPTLARYAQISPDPGRQAFLSYQRLIEDPREVLTNLGSWLGLTEELSETYRTFDFTGSRGDPSERIQSRRIRSDFPKRQIDLEAEAFDHLQVAHLEARTVLRARCTVL